MNTDYKILCGAPAVRLKKGISSIISETQSSFLKRRSDLLLFIIIYLLMVDIVFSFILLRHLIVWNILFLYKHCLTLFFLSLGHVTRLRFPIRKVLRQSCAPLLFIMVAEMISILIKNSELEGLKVSENALMISQLPQNQGLNSIRLANYKYVF